jgi:hypothetical protein
MKIRDIPNYTQVMNAYQQTIQSVREIADNYTDVLQEKWLKYTLWLATLPCIQ